MNGIANYLKQLAFRERLILVGGGFAALLMMVWAFGVDTAYKQAGATDRLVERKLTAADELSGVLAEYSRIQNRMASATSGGNTPKNFSLLSFVEGLATRAQVGEIKSMRPITADVAEGVVEQAVEVKLKEVRLEPVVRLLTDVERSPHALRIKSLHMKRRFSDPDLMEVTFTVARYVEA
ncbi:MAG: type II secretion system protein GspM [Nitrospirota bacterium]|nr:type II secretion system protein GspM [Nitrospirota bacterium]